MSDTPLLPAERTRRSSLRSGKIVASAASGAVSCTVPFLFFPFLLFFLAPFPVHFADFEDIQFQPVHFRFVAFQFCHEIGKGSQEVVLLVARNFVVGKSACGDRILLHKALRILPYIGARIKGIGEAQSDGGVVLPDDFGRQGLVRSGEGDRRIAAFHFLLLRYLRSLPAHLGDEAQVPRGDLFDAVAQVLSPVEHILIGDCLRGRGLPGRLFLRRSCGSGLRFFGKQIKKTHGRISFPEETLYLFYSFLSIGGKNSEYSSPAPPVVSVTMKGAGSEKFARGVYS